MVAGNQLTRCDGLEKQKMNYTELQVTTNFSFLRGASHPEEMVEQAAAYGYTAIAITDRNTFAGMVRGHVAAKKSGIRIIPGCRLDLREKRRPLVGGSQLLQHRADHVVVMRHRRRDAALTARDVLHAPDHALRLVREDKASAARPEPHAAGTEPDGALETPGGARAAGEEHGAAAVEFALVLPDRDLAWLTRRTRSSDGVIRISSVAGIAISGANAIEAIAAVGAIVPSSNSSDRPAPRAL